MGNLHHPATVTQIDIYGVNNMLAGILALIINPLHIHHPFTQTPLQPVT
jgi:hypothetical protein